MAFRLKLTLAICLNLLAIGQTQALELGNLMCVSNNTTDGTQYSHNSDTLLLSSRGEFGGAPKVINAGKEITHQMPNNGTFCSCDNSKPSNYYVANYTEWSGGIRAHYNGWELINPSNEAPFLIGVEIETNGKFVKIPTGITYERKQVKCSSKDLLPISSDTYGKNYTLPSNRTIRLTLFSKKGRMLEAGKYNITNMPQIKSYRRLASGKSVSKGQMASQIPETIFSLGQSVEIHESCRFQNGDRKVVDLGRIDYNSLNVTTPDNKPRGFSPVPVNISIKCDGGSSGEANVKFLDSNNPSSREKHLSTNLDGVGVQLKFGGSSNIQNTVRMGRNYKDAITIRNNGVGTLSFTAYPVKTKPEDAQMGTYQAETTVIIEKH